MAFRPSTLAKIAKNADAFAVSTGYAQGRLAGRSSGGVLSAADIVCTGNDQQNLLSIPSEGPASDTRSIDRDFADLITRAKAAREPMALVDIRLRELSLTPEEREVLDRLEAKKRRLAELKRKKLPIGKDDQLTNKELAQLKLLGVSRAGDKYAERHGGQRLTPKQIQMRAELEVKSHDVASAQDRIVEILRDPNNAVVPTNKGKTTWLSGGAMFVQNSGNEKIMDAVGDDAKGSRNTATTYAAINPTCPTSCLQRGVSCYAETSNNIRPIVLLLEHIARELDHDDVEVARDEARAIDASFPLGIRVPTDLRIHTVGDARKPESVRALAAAAGRWLDRSAWTKNPKYRAVAKKTPPAAWSYTHGFHEHHRSDWGRVSVLASVSVPKDIEEARQRGFAPTCVVPSHTYGTTTDAGEEKAKDGKKLVEGRDFENKYRRGDNGENIPFFTPEGAPIPFPIRGTDVQWIPCPAQNPDASKRVGCVSCRICFHDDELKKNGQGVAFQAHASGKVRGVPFMSGEFEAEYAEAQAARTMASVTRQIRGKVQTSHRGAPRKKEAPLIQLRRSKA